MAEMKTLTVDGKTYEVVDETARTAAADAQAAIPTKTSQLTNDSGFITIAPVTSVNGMIGAVSLEASDVGARPDTWVPSDSELGLSTKTWELTYADGTTETIEVCVKWSLSLQ